METLAPEIPSLLGVHKKDLSREIVYEVKMAGEDLPFSIAIADIQQSQPHYHNHTIETYTVVQGDIEVRLNDERRALRPGEIVLIEPGTVHSARTLGDMPARVVVVCVPEWQPEDYHPVD